MAQLCCLVTQALHVFSRAPGPVPKGDLKRFLPFPDWKPHENEKQGPSEITLLKLREALRRREIPMHVYLALQAPPENES